MCISESECSPWETRTERESESERVYCCAAPPNLLRRCALAPSVHLIHRFSLSPSSSSSLKITVHIPVLGVVPPPPPPCDCDRFHESSPPRPISPPFPHLHSQNNRRMDLSQCRSPRPVRPPHWQSNAMRLEGAFVSASKLHLGCRRPHALRRLACGPSKKKKVQGGWGGSCKPASQSKME